MIYRTYKLPTVPVIIVRTFTSSVELPPTEVHKLEQLKTGDTIYICLPHTYIECQVA